MEMEEGCQFPVWGMEEGKRDRETDDARNRAKSLVRNIYKAKGMVIEVMERK